VYFVGVCGYEGRGRGKGTRKEKEREDILHYTAT